MLSSLRSAVRSIALSLETNPHSTLHLETQHSKCGVEPKERFTRSSLPTPSQSLFISIRATLSCQSFSTAQSEQTQLLIERTDSECALCRRRDARVVRWRVPQVRSSRTSPSRGARSPAPLQCAPGHECVPEGVSRGRCARLSAPAHHQAAVSGRSHGGQDGPAVCPARTPSAHSRRPLRGHAHAATPHGLQRRVSCL